MCNVVPTTTMQDRVKLSLIYGQAIFHWEYYVIEKIYTVSIITACLLLIFWKILRHVFYSSRTSIREQRVSDLKRMSRNSTKGVAPEPVKVTLQWPEWCALCSERHMYFKNNFPKVIFQLPIKGALVTSQIKVIHLSQVF